MKAVLIVSHGSRSPKLRQEIEWLIHLLRQKSSIPIFHYAFLEMESPTILEGIDQCVGDGATEINVLLNFLNSGKHVDEDIPNIVYQGQLTYPHVRFQISRPVGQHKDIADLFISMIQ